MDAIAQLILSNILAWWDCLPPNLRQDIEGSGAEPGCIALARRHLSTSTALTQHHMRVELEETFGVKLGGHPFMSGECDCDAGFFEPDCILKGCRHTREEHPAQILGMGAP